MIRVEPNDVIYAGAGILWGVVTLFRNASLHQKKLKELTLTVTGAIVMLGGLGYLIWATGWRSPL